MDDGRPQAETARRWPSITPARIALAVWLLTALLQLLFLRDQIADFRSYDPDDSLRLVQVRDLMGGQAWWDVTQYRINPTGGGGQMHWSRIVDAPIAALILLIEPLTGQATAERIAASAVPLLLLLGTMLALATILTRLGNRWLVLAGLLMLPATPVVLTQLTALRIDHHGWQVMLAAVMLALALGEATFRRGALTGLAGAILLAISLEGLPLAALFAVMAGAIWAWTGDRADRARLDGYLLALGLGAILLQWATRGPSGLLGHWCDGLSLPYLGLLGIAAIGGPVATWLAGQTGAGRAGRLALLATVAVAAAATLALIEPACLRGPFATLDPIVHRHWYLKVAEGGPLWRSEPPLIVFMLVPILTGMVGTALAFRRAADSVQRRNWAVTGIALLSATLLGLAVSRSGATAQLFALPGIAAPALIVWHRARAISSALPRVLGSLGVLLFIPLVSGMIAMALIVQIVTALGGSTERLRPKVDAHPAMACFDDIEMRGLAALPPALIFAPLDIGPNLLRYSPHSTVATGHHRNNRAMAQVLTALRSDPEEAEAEVRATGATLVAVCPFSGDIAYHAASAPGSLAARLKAGEPVDWLEPVPMGAGSDLRLWRVKPPTP